MKKLIVSVLCTIMSAQLIVAMDQEPILDRKIWKKLPQVISTKIVQLYIITEHHKYTDFPQISRHMQEFYWFNKSMPHFLNNPQTIRIIFNKRFPSSSSYVMATQLGTRGSKNYIKQSEALHNEFTSTSFNPSKIDELISAGADINCYPSDADPILFKILRSQEKLQRALNLGADVNAINQDQKTPLAHAIKKKFLPAISLLLSYNPQDKCVSTAVQKNSRSVMKLLIKNGNLTRDQLIAGLCESVQTKKTELIPLFAQADPEIHQWFNLSLQFAQQIKNITNDPQEQENALVFTPHLCKLSDTDLRRVGKTCRRTPSSSNLVHAILEQHLPLAEKKREQND